MHNKTKINKKHKKDWALNKLSLNKSGMCKIKLISSNISHTLIVK